MAAAVAASGRGMRVELFEQAKTLGGRAASFADPETGQTIDYCQHVAMGCCREFLNFCRLTGVGDCFERADRLHFIDPSGRQYDFSASRWLPAPLNLLPGLIRLGYLSLSERWHVVRAMRRLMDNNTDETKNSRGPTARGDTSRFPKSDETIGAWLLQQRQSERAIELFWSPVLISALSETGDRGSLTAARKVFRDGFLASRDASQLVLPRRPLAEIFRDGVGLWLAEHGVKVHLGTPVRQIEGDGQRAESLVLDNGTRRKFDSVVVAVPWRGVRALFAENLAEAIPALSDAERIEPAAITAIHLWFDRPITRLPHAVLLGRLSQWLFAGRRDPGVSSASELPSRESHYYQVVVSASHRLPPRKNEQWLADVRADLESAWPEAKEAKLLHGRVVTMPAAVFSVTPESELLRAPQRTPLANVCLAGDWTQTGWPGTMEGAVRSGRQAIEALLDGNRSQTEQ
jgi:squalene-associated FAD-dependent desaturase